MPYRSGGRHHDGQAPRDAGIVGDVIQQFADRFAFYRELVQNAIDAGTEEVSIELSYDPSREVMVVSVADSGEGMDRDVIENRLLVLFRSTKENDDTKIGKFGIGFASVLAMRPELIRVTSVHDGSRHILQLYPDLSYELFDGGPASRTGTMVEMEVPLAEGERESFVAQSTAALMRWCRHATTAISVRGTGHSDEVWRVDRPLGLEDALVEVAATSKDGQTKVVVGLREKARPYAGFFNYGLTLYESDGPLVGNLAFKAQDARLGHTLSRDDVRRDRHFKDVLDFVREIADQRLPAVAAAALTEAAKADDLGPYQALLEAVAAANLRIDFADLAVPLMELCRGQRHIDAATWLKQGAWSDGTSSRLTSHLAAVGIPVLRLGTDAICSILETLCSTTSRWAQAELTLATPEEPTTEEGIMLDFLLLDLGEVYRRPTTVTMAALEGFGSYMTAVAGRSDTSGPWLVDEDDLRRNPFSFLRRAPLVLNTNAPAVIAARARAARDPRVAAALLVRTLLLERNKLDVDRSAKLVEDYLEELLG